MGFLKKGNHQFFLFFLSGVIPCLIPCISRTSRRVKLGLVNSAAASKAGRRGRRLTPQMFITQPVSSYRGWLRNPFRTKLNHNKPLLMVFSGEANYSRALIGGANWISSIHSREGCPWVKCGNRDHFWRGPHPPVINWLVD